MNFGELSGVKLLGVLVLAGVIGTGALYYTVFKSQREENATAQISLQAKMRENAELEAYKPKLADIERQLASLKQQLDIERRIVPDEKEVDNFMRMVSGEARKAGIEIRRYTAKPVSAKDCLIGASASADKRAKSSAADALSPSTANFPP